MSAYRVPLIAGGGRAITNEADISHGRYAFFVRNGNGGAHTGSEIVYIRGNNHYLWWGKDPICLSLSVGGDSETQPSLVTRFSTWLVGIISEPGEHSTQYACQLGCNNQESTLSG